MTITCKDMLAAARIAVPSIDAAAAIGEIGSGVVTLPFIYPVVQHFNINATRFGIIIVKLIAMDVMTPPVGMNVFAVMSAVNDMETTFRHVVVGVIPFLIMEAFVLGLLIAFPELPLSLWLPRQMLAG